MNSTATPSYERAPSRMLQVALSRGPLTPLLSLGSRKVASCRLDVHLRAGDEVHVYCGLTRPIVVSLKKTGAVRVGANKSYAKQECAKEFFGLWRQDRMSGQEFDSKLTGYLGRVAVNSRWVRREGRVQTAWSGIIAPWVPFDREAVLGYASTPERDRARSFKAVDGARARVDALRVSEKWAKLPGRGGEVDQLAVDSDGHLVVIELKDASSSGVYYTPLQLLQYVWEWHSAFDAVSDALQELLDARVALKLAPLGVTSIGPRIRPVVGFGADDRSEKVSWRYAKVLEVVNDHLPPGVAPVETWVLDWGCPKRIGPA